MPYTFGPSLVEYKDYLSVPMYEIEAWENDITNFTVIGYEYEQGVYPDDVDLTLILPDGSFESIPMTNVSTFFVRDGSLEGTEFLASVNMSDYFDFNEQSSYVGFFFNASLNDGNSSAIWGDDVSTPDLYSDGINPSAEGADVYDGMYYDVYDHPFEIYIRSIDKDGDPQIVTYRIDELTGVQPMSYPYEGTKRSWSFGLPLAPTRIDMYSEDIFRITAWVRDEAGTHQEAWDQTPDNFTFVPQVILTDDGVQETIDMMWCGYDEDLGADMYYVDLTGWGDYSYEWDVDPDTGEGDWNSTSLGPGVWDISFNVEDSQSNSGSLIATHKFFHQGSMTSFMSSFWGGYDQSMLFDKTTWFGQIMNLFTSVRPMITLGLFIAGGVLEFAGVKFNYMPATIISVILNVATVVIDFIAKFTSIQTFVDNNDAGGLMGAVFNMMLSMLFLTVTGSMTSLFGTKKSIGGKVMSKASQYFFKTLHFAASLNMIIALLSSDGLTIYGAAIALLMSFVTSKLFEKGLTKPIYKLATFLMPFVTMGLMWFGKEFLQPIFDMLNGSLTAMGEFLSPIANIGTFILSGPFQFATLLMEALGIGIIFTMLDKVRTSCGVSSFSPTRMFGVLPYVILEGILIGYSITMWFVMTDAWEAMWLSPPSYIITE